MSEKKFCVLGFHQAFVEGFVAEHVNGASLVAGERTGAFGVNAFGHVNAVGTHFEFAFAFHGHVVGHSLCGDGVDTFGQCCYILSKFPYVVFGVAGACAVNIHTENHVLVFLIV